MRLSPVTLAVLSVFVAGLVASGVWLLGLESDCRARWQGSGFQHDYRNGQCMVLAGSRWLPETSVKIHVREPG
jgi:hypothetical protein